MSGKKISIGGKPTRKKEELGDAWVKQAKHLEKEGEPMKRLTLDIPKSIHQKLKADCSMRDVSMVEEIRKILTDRYGN